MTLWLISGCDGKSTMFINLVKSFRIRTVSHYRPVDALRISRGIKSGTSDIHVFSSHFFTTLKNESASAVTKWTATRRIDIFKKKLIFIPINDALHWSLSVVVNPGAVLDTCKGEGSLDGPLCCMLFFDSLRAHKKSSVHRNVAKWLNSEWKRLKKGQEASKEDPFLDKLSFPVYEPTGKLTDFSG